jgi:hypothetical protein
VCTDLHAVCHAVLGLACGCYGCRSRQLLSDLDIEDGTAEEVKAADMAAFREIRLHQKSTRMLMSRDAFTRVAQDVLQQQGGGEQL